MGFSDYQERLETSCRRAELIDKYIDEHELLESAYAFESSFDRNEAALREVWRILMVTRPSDSDIGMADIRSVLDGLILAAAEAYADNVERHRDFIGVPV